MGRVNIMGRMKISSSKKQYIKEFNLSLYWQVIINTDLYV